MKTSFQYKETTIISIFFNEIISLGEYFMIQYSPQPPPPPPPPPFTKIMMVNGIPKTFYMSITNNKTFWEQGANHNMNIL